MAETPSPHDSESPSAAATPATPVASKPSRTLAKRLVYSTLACLIGLVAIELAVRVVFALSDFDLEKLQQTQQRIAVHQQDDSAPPEVIHPYLGWVINPEAKHDQHINRLGLIGDVPIIEKRQPKQLRIAIVGGSVALQLAESSADLISERLKARPKFTDFDVQIIPLALSGYKQPQQILQLSYLMSLGAEFDVVLNIDGYNEIALHRDENGSADVFYAYPRAWHTRMVKVMDPVRVERAFRVFELQVARIRLAEWIQRPPYRYSAVLNLYWQWRDRSLYAEFLTHGVDVMQMKHEEGLGYHITGPRESNPSDEKTFGDLADLWMNASLQTHRLCAANGMTYLHFIQPNQYVKGSKPMSDKERDDFVYPTQGYGKSVVQGYPLLSDRGKRLVEQGVDFHDLTMLFATTTEPVYSDPFCHFNELGDKILATKIADELIRSLEAQR
ncbi:MAG: hypothetical protein O3A00_10740 [Planctomycetota bacterium]|nr:hypothetical protein [Planctomycetota bacterium]